MDFKKQEFVGFVVSLFFWLQFGYWEKINFFLHFFHRLSQRVHSFNLLFGTERQFWKVPLITYITFFGISCILLHQISVGIGQWTIWPNVSVDADFASVETLSRQRLALVAEYLGPLLSCVWLEQIMYNDNKGRVPAIELEI